MRSFFYLIGILCTLLFILGLFELLDFRVCIKPKGQCEIPSATKQFKSEYITEPKPEPQKIKQ